MKSHVLWNRHDIYFIKIYSLYLPNSQGYFAKCETKSTTFGLRFSENNTKVKVELECVLFTCFLTADEDSQTYFNKWATTLSSEVCFTNIENSYVFNPTAAQVLTTIILEAFYEFYNVFKITTSCSCRTLVPRGIWVELRNSQPESTWISRGATVLQLQL